MCGTLFVAADVIAFAIYQLILLFLFFFIVTQMHGTKLYHSITEISFPLLVLHAATNLLTDAERQARQNTICTEMLVRNK